MTITDLGVIGQARVELGPGLTVLTGETGAGKTMILTGLGLLLGGRADPGVVRLGTPAAAVEGRLRLPPGSPALRRAEQAGAELDSDGSLVVVRTVAAPGDGSPGRSRAHLGGRSVPQAVLAELADDLVTVHGQADQARLRSPARQREALDAFAGPDHLQLLAEYQDAWVQRQAVAAELRTLTEQTAQRAREAELVRLGVAQVERAAPRAGEDAELDAEIARLSHAEDLRAAAASAHAALSGADDPEAPPSATDSADRARRLLEQAGDHDAVLAGLAGRVAEAGYLLSDVAAELASYLADLQADPLRLDEAQRRRAELAALARTYGGDVAAVLDWVSRAGDRLLELDRTDERLAELRTRYGELGGRLAELAAQVGEQRRDAAGRLAAAVTTELASLAMVGAALQVQVHPLAEPGPHGAEDVQLLLIPHAGAPARELGRGASGGELSRVMLAIEVSLATAPGAATPPTFVFDEVDAGVGGRAAVEVGRRLARLARTSQVLVVTHLAQVAAFGDRHLVVTKSVTDGIDVVTASDVRAVDGEDRVRELARMLAGHEDSVAARAHAAELLEQSGVGR